MKSLLIALFLVLTLNAPAQTLSPSTYTTKHHYTGVIGGKYKFLMNLFFDKEKIDGEYRYFTQKDFIKVEGTYNAATKKFNLTESIYDYKKDEKKITGYFEGTRNGNTVTGKWFNKERTKSFDFTLATDEKPMPDFKLTDDLKIDDTDKVITKIVFKHPKGSQALEGFESRVFKESDGAIQMEDITFDGYLDLTVVEFTGTANTAYLYWVYDPATMKFVKHDELTANDPVVDVQSKRIVSSWRDGYATYGTSQYIFQDGKFFLIEESESNLETNKTKTTKYKVENGKSIKL